MDDIPTFTASIPVEPRHGERFMADFTQTYDGLACTTINGEEYSVSVHDLMQLATSMYLSYLMGKVDNTLSAARATAMMKGMR